LPKLGELIAGDAHSYQYLAESIRKHPNQAGLKALMEEAGFEQCAVQNLSGGIVAIHSGFKI
jgi:demethylmenaquinone methyltransferase/2-methoxy-6-polyprenyl-1,4-benzoquinol methylase